MFTLRPHNTYSIPIFTSTLCVVTGQNSAGIALIGDGLKVWMNSAESTETESPEQQDGLQQLLLAAADVYSTCLSGEGAADVYNTCLSGEGAARELDARK